MVKISSIVNKIYFKDAADQKRNSNSSIKIWQTNVIALFKNFMLNQINPLFTSRKITSLIRIRV